MVDGGRSIAWLGRGSRINTYGAGDGYLQMTGTFTYALVF